jgi:erythromycin esterase-like protein
MADHLLWLLREQYPLRKVIVWAAGAHTRYAEPQLWARNNTITMGEVMREALGPAVFHLSFSAYQGMTANPNWLPGSWPVESGELQDLLHEAGFQQAIVDLRHPAPGADWLRQPLLMNKAAALRTPPHVGQDAIFYVDTERPVTAVK